MGLFTAQIAEGGMTQVSVEYTGEVANLKLEPVTLASLKGLLSPTLQENVNYVNAPLIAKDRGIEVKVSQSQDTTEYTSLITIRIKADGKQVSVSGTLNSRKEPRIIQVDNFPMETVPAGDMLVFMNNDKPGVIGNIGTTLGQNKINISHMQFGRESEGGLAMSVVSVDSVVPDAVMDKLRALPNVLKVKQIRI
jgi:D-3-phosphoglycerate dehydrogenase